MPEEPFVTYLLHDEELLVAETSTGWTVRYRGREVQDALIDHALAAALGWSYSAAFHVALRVLGSAPGTEVG